MRRGKPRLLTPPDSPRVPQETCFPCLGKGPGDWGTGQESDDSGRGTCTDQSDQSDCSPRSCRVHDKVERKPESTGSAGGGGAGEARGSGSQKVQETRNTLHQPFHCLHPPISSQKSIDAKLSLLSMRRCGLDSQLQAIRGKLEGIEVELGAVATHTEVKRLQAYVENSEKATLLLLGIARRIAREENSGVPKPQRSDSLTAMKPQDSVSVRLSQLQDSGHQTPTLPEDSSSRMTLKLKRLSGQLEDAKELSVMVNRRLPKVEDSLERWLGVGRREEFLGCLDQRTQLLVVRKEVQDRIDMEEENS